MSDGRERMRELLRLEGFGPRSIGCELTESDYDNVLDAMSRYAAEAVAAEREVTRGLLKVYDRETCTHEETHRGGALWTICDGCGRNWADDQGGFQPYVDPPEVAAARRSIEGGGAVAARKSDAERRTPQDSKK